MRQSVAVKPGESLVPPAQVSEPTSGPKIEHRNKIPEFPGQQDGEKVLYHTKPDRRMELLTIVGVVFVGIVLIFLLQFFFSFAGAMFAGFETPLLLVSVATIIIVCWWINEVYTNTDIYITDRRMLRFQPVMPYRRTTRSLFWDEAIKVKTYYKNIILEKILGIGSLEVHGRNHERDNVDVEYVTYHEDLGNYIDKILFLYKNKPDDLHAIKTFIPKPVGLRY